MRNLNLRKFFLYLLIASVGLSALIGVVVMIFGNFGDFETRILLTTLTVTVTSILGLACGACLEAGRGRLLPVTGIVFAVISAVLWIIVVWANTRDSKYFANLVMTATLVAASCSHIALLSLATLDRRFLWSHWAAHLSVWSLTAIILWIIWWNIDPSDSWIARTMGVLSIIIGSLTVVTPVFHKLSSSGSGTDAIDVEIERLRARIEELETKKKMMA